MTEEENFPHLIVCLTKLSFAFSSIRFSLRFVAKR